MLPKTGDYLIATVSGEKPKLVQVTSVSSKSGVITGLLNDGPSKEGHDEPVKLIPADVWANLGEQPRPGNAFGVKVEPYLKSVKSPFGRIDFYRNVSDVERKILIGGFKKVWKKTDGRLRELFPFNRIEIRPAKGKMAGCYKYSKGGHSSSDDWIILNPQFIDREMISYYIWHEVAHGIWFRMLSPKVKAAWVSAYSRRMDLRQMKENILIELRKEVESSGSLEEYFSENEEPVLMKEVLKHVKRVHRLSRENLNLLLVQQKPLDRYWPAYYELGEPNTIDVSEYATKNVEEFFAEVVAWSKTGRKMPKSLRSLYVKTLSSL